MVENKGTANIFQLTPLVSTGRARARCLPFVDHLLQEMNTRMFVALVRLNLQQTVSIFTNVLILQFIRLELAVPRMHYFRAELFKQYWPEVLYNFQLDSNIKYVSPLGLYIKIFVLFVSLSANAIVVLRLRKPS